MPNPRKIVLDTNCLIASLSRHSEYYSVWKDFQAGKYTLCVSTSILQEYEEMINSGDPVSLAQVIRELYKGAGESALSFGEKQVYQLAMERLAKEISIIENIEETEAVRKLEGVLQAA